VACKKRWVLTDFGFSTILESKSVAQSRLGRGTEAYRAPELIEEGSKISAGMVSKYGDIWSLGCVMFLLATTGEKHAFGSDWAAVAYKQQHQGYQSVPQLDSEISPFTGLGSKGDRFRSELNSILASCFEREPKQRPTSRNLLERVLRCGLMYL